MELTTAQITKLEEILNAGFKFIAVERAERYVGVERGGFVALLESIGGQIKFFSPVGYLLGEGIAMLVESTEGKRFVWHDHSLFATSEMLANYEQFKKELTKILGAGSVALKTEV